MSEPVRSARGKRNQSLRKYGLDPEQFDAILERQGGVCAICYSDDPQGRWSTWCVDHSHKTDEVRALLCFQCNVGVGSFQDDPERLRRAADYLELPSLAKW